MHTLLLEIAAAVAAGPRAGLVSWDVPSPRSRVQRRMERGKVPSFCSLYEGGGNV